MFKRHARNERQIGRSEMGSAERSRGLNQLGVQAEFTVWIPAVRDQDVYVVGGLPELGIWNIEQAFRLSKKGTEQGTFSGRLEISSRAVEHGVFEYKYFKKVRSSDEIQWEDRNGNRKAVISEADKVLGELQIRDDLTAIEVVVKEKLQSDNVMYICGPARPLGSGNIKNAVPMNPAHGDLWKSPTFQGSAEVLAGEGLRVSLCPLPRGSEMNSDEVQELWLSGKRELTVAVPGVNAHCFEDECCKSDLLDVATRVRRGLDLAERVRDCAETTRDPEMQEVAVVLRKSDEEARKATKRIDELVKQCAELDARNKSLEEDLRLQRDASKTLDLSKGLGDADVALTIQSLKDENDGLRQRCAALKIQLDQVSDEKETAENNNARYEIHLARMSEDLSKLEQMVTKLAGPDPEQVS